MTARTFSKNTSMGQKCEMSINKAIYICDHKCLGKITYVKESNGIKEVFVFSLLKCLSQEFSHVYIIHFKRTQTI